MHQRAYLKNPLAFLFSAMAAACLLACLSPRLSAGNASDTALTLPAADGKDYTPLAASDKKAVVLFFVSAYCPTSNTFVPEINKIVADYNGKFAFYLVHADSDLKLTDVLQHTEMMGVKTTVLMDKEQKLVKLTQAKTTPEVVVLAPDGKTLYQGRINDLYLGPTRKQRQATTKDLRDALDAIQSGNPVANARTEAMGCKISGVK
jgi:thiol-disulfide isomerase/thioredoxin